MKEKVKGKRKKERKSGKNSERKVKGKRKSERKKEK